MSKAQVIDDVLIAQDIMRHLPRLPGMDGASRG